MITFKNIGMNGRFGNTLFSYAALFGIAKKLGVEHGIPYENAKEPTKLGYYDFFAKKWIHYRFDLADVFNITAKDIPFGRTPDNLYYEKHFQFDPKVFELPDGTDINGWFQSYRYFSHCEDELRQELDFKDEFVINAIEHWTKFGFEKGRRGKRKLMISMRLDDGYSFDKNFNTTSVQFYTNALSYLKDLDKYDIVITADNPLKCEEVLKTIIGDRKIHVLNEPCPYTTTAFYSLCDDFIIPNSTFAWWGAWFGTTKDKSVILPKKWFNADVPFGDMHPTNWIRI